MIKPKCFGADHVAACDECDWFTACAEARAVTDKDYICIFCSGSGEGMTDGSKCSSCHGSGAAQ